MVIEGLNKIVKITNAISDKEWWSLSTLEPNPKVFDF